MLAEGLDEIGADLASMAIGITSYSASIEPLPMLDRAPDFADLLAAVAPAEPPVEEQLVEQMLATGGGDRLTTTSDFDELEMPRALKQFLSSNRGVVGSVTPEAVTAAVAVDRARALAHSLFQPEHFEALRAHPPYADQNALVSDAAVLMTQGATGETLARLILAEELWPNDPTVRFNLASLLTAVGMANEAFAILEELRSTRRAPIGAFDVAPESFLDYGRGYALLKLGAVDEAEALLDAVARREPNFAEASLALSLALDEQKKNPRAAFIAGHYRRPAASATSAPSADSESGSVEQQGTPIEAADAITEAVIQLSGVYFVDVAKGTPGVLPAIMQPTTIETQIAYRKRMVSELPNLAEQARIMTRTRNRLNKAWQNGDLQPALRARYMAIASNFSEANAPVPQIQDLLRRRNRAVRAQTDIQDVITDFVGDNFLEIQKRHKSEWPKMCPEIRSLVNEASARLRIDVQHVDMRERRLHRAWHQYATAIGSLVADPAFRAYLDAEIRLANHVWYMDLVAGMMDSTQFAELAADCPMDPPADIDLAGNVEGSHLAKCDDSAAQSGLSGGGGPVSVNISCGGIQIVLNADLGPLKLTAEVNVDETGKVTDATTGAEVDAGVVKVSGGTSIDDTGQVTKRTVGGGVDIGVVEVAGEVESDGAGNVTKASGNASGRVGPVKIEGKGSVKSNGDVTIYAGSKLGDKGSGVGATVAAEVSGGVSVSGNVDSGTINNVALISKASTSVSAGGYTAGAETSNTFVIVSAPQTPSIVCRRATLRRRGPRRHNRSGPGPSGLCRRARRPWRSCARTSATPWRRRRCRPSHSRRPPRRILHHLRQGLELISGRHPCRAAFRSVAPSCSRLLLPNRRLPPLAACWPRHADEIQRPAPPHDAFPVLRPVG